MNISEQYNATTLRILGKLQLLEFALKTYIGFSYQIIQKKLDGAIKFDYSLEDVDSHPLERLLTTFAKLNNDTELQKQLNSLRVKRNHLVHKSLLINMGRKIDDSTLGKANEEFFYLEEDVDSCLQVVLAELKSLKQTMFGSEA